MSLTSYIIHSLGQQDFTWESVIMSHKLKMTEARHVIEPKFELDSRLVLLLPIFKYNFRLHLVVLPLEASDNRILPPPEFFIQ